LLLEAQNKRQAGAYRSTPAVLPPEGQAGIRQIDSFNSFEARKATFLLALI
jgi:hypothetical protein